MIKSIRRTAPAILAAAVLCLSIFQYCAVDEEGGATVGSSPASPSDGNTSNPSGGGSGSSGGSGGSGGGGQVPGPIFVEGGESQGNETSLTTTKIRAGQTATITVRLLADTSRNAAGLNNKWVRVEHDGLGTLLNSSGEEADSVLTDRNGNATVKYLSTTSAESVILTFKYGSTTGTANVVVTDFSIPRLRIVDITPTVIDADGVSTSRITVRVVNDDGNPFVGETVKFSSPQGGTIIDTAITDAFGRATTTLMSERRNITVRVYASLVNGGGDTASGYVTFANAKLTVSADKKSVRPGEDITVTATLKDAAIKPIFAEDVKFTAKTASGVELNWSRTVATDVYGNAVIRIDGDVNTGEDIYIFADVGWARENTGPISVSNREIKIEPVAGRINTCASRGATSTYRISYKDDDGRPIADAQLMVSVTIGLIMVPNTIFTQKIVTTDDEYYYITINNPLFADSGFIYVKTPGDENEKYDDAQFPISFRACGVKRIELTVSSNVINVLSDAENKANSETSVIATAYDANNNRMSGVWISFNLIEGSGGGTTLDPKVVQTKRDGKAITTLTAGMTPSTFQGIGVVASNYYPDEDGDSVRSNIARLTIAGPPHRINVGWALGGPTDAGAAAYSLGVSALVSDVNGNPVRNREVTFSAIVNGWSEEVMGNGNDIRGCKNKPHPDSAAARAAVTITKSVNTDENGVAVNAVIYSQSYAARINVILWVESGGLVTYSESLDLPVPDRIREPPSTWSACQIFGGIMP
jgi:hypothetical protein